MKVKHAWLAALLIAVPCALGVAMLGAQERKLPKAQFVKGQNFTFSIGSYTVTSTIDEVVASRLAVK